MAYWLLKSEPDMFGIDDLAKCQRRTEHWDGVRNYQARNYLRAMRRGDQAFFYHSSCAAPGVYGVVDIVRAAYPDPSADDPQSPYYDPRSTGDNPRWFMVDVRLQRKLKRPVSLSQIKQTRALRKLPLVQRGNRLSVMPVSPTEWATILKLTGEH